VPVTQAFLHKIRDVIDLASARRLRADQRWHGSIVSEAEGSPGGLACRVGTECRLYELSALSPFRPRIHL